MFTGLVEDVGQIVLCAELPSGQGRRLRIAAPILAQPQQIGASIAVDGVCLTVVAWDEPGEIDVEVGPETLSRTTLGEVRVGARINLERPLRLGDRLGGHLVAGHVDAVGTVARAVRRGEALDLTIATPPALLRYIIEKGSIAVDGISLTVNHVDSAGFTVSLIPHTQAATTLAGKGPGERVNLEVDMIGKYVESLMRSFRAP